MRQELLAEQASFCYNESVWRRLIPVPPRTTGEKENDMSKRCPDCGFVNEDSKIYCGSCGEPLDAHLRLMRDLEAQKKPASAKKAEPTDPAPAPRKRINDDDDNFVYRKMSKEEKSSPLPWILLAVGILVVVAGLLILNYAV